MAMSKGCTIGLIIGIVIVVIIITGIVLIWINKDKIMEAGIDYIVDQTETEIVNNLPEEYTPEMVHQIMTDFKAAAKNEQLDGEQIQELVSTFQAAVMADKQIDEDKGRRLLILVQEVLGQEPPPIPDEPVLPDSLEAVPDSI